MIEEQDKIIKDYMEIVEDKNDIIKTYEGLDIENPADKWIYGTGGVIIGLILGIFLTPAGN